MKLRIYFKSGNIVTTKGVKSWEVGGSGSINSIKVLYKKRFLPFSKSRVIVKSIDLENIDCIVEL